MYPEIVIKKGTNLYTINEIQSGTEQLKKEIEWLKMALNCNVEQTDKVFPEPPMSLKQILICWLEEKERLLSKCELAVKHAVNTLRIIEIDC
ncbi:hypothetical protein DNHGIG_26320 [Collibacillus ludicampi]|uniref:Uncharacterized protein n=1 Tax=Collibacillus ludicampi TaxID=2771369 RepID=A0AAV4LHF0_9BACL|nr:hypothetical protein [Collibacillus ludicampi]GIM47083.1 hypothetical protein DNHGIG_26320 [Collibacillus ludicampi]